MPFGEIIPEMAAGDIFIHPTAVVSAEASIAAGSTIGPFAVVEERAEVGCGCIVGPRAVIKTGTRIGDRNRVGAGAVLGNAPQDLAFDGSHTTLEIGCDNGIGPAATVHRASGPGRSTVIGDRTRILARGHVAHDCVLGDGAVLGAHALLAGHVSVEQGALIGAGAVVHQFVRVGRCAAVAPKSKVVKDVLPFALAAGNPARLEGAAGGASEPAGLLDDPERRAIAAAIDMLSQTAPSLAERLAGLQGSDSPAVRELAEFVRSSRRGVTGFRRR